MVDLYSGASGNVGTARVLINDGTGTFTLDANHPFLAETKAPEIVNLRVADLDNDGGECAHVAPRTHAEGRRTQAGSCPHSAAVYARVTMRA